jgi:hypothetical protein
MYGCCCPCPCGVAICPTCGGAGVVIRRRRVYYPPVVTHPVYPVLTPVPGIRVSGSAHLDLARARA